MNSFLQHGFWTAPSQEYPAHSEFMSIDPLLGRIVSGVVADIDPIEHATIALWYYQTESELIYTRLKLTDCWRPSFYRLAENVIYWRWTHDGTEYPWTLVLSSELPVWFMERLDRSYAKMDLQQKEAEQGAAANP